MLASQPLLQLGKRESASIAPGDDLTIDDELTRQRQERCSEFREFHEFIECPREQFDSCSILVSLRSHAVVFVLDDCPIAELIHCFGGGLDGARQHEANRLKQM